MEPIHHRLTAVWFADLVGYSRLASSDEAAALGLVRRFQSEARATAERHGGRLVKFLGDGALAEFPSTESAVRAAIDLRRRLAAGGESGGLRVGVHVGDVVTDGDGDLYGDGVNVAARLQSEAEPGQVVVSEDVWRQLRPRREFRFEPLGERALKGLDDPVTVFAVDVEGEIAPGVTDAAPSPAEPTGSRTRRRLTGRTAILAAVLAVAVLAAVAALLLHDRSALSPDPAIAGAAGPGVAVLPFRTSGPELDVWREGVIDLVSANLDGAAGLRAIDGRTVMARWNEALEGAEEPDLTESLDVARRAGARYALVGSATALGPEVRLLADVYDLESGESLGRAQAEGAPDSVYALIDQLSIAVLETILREQPDDIPRVDLAHVTTASLPALKAYLEGELLFRRSDFDGAIEPYERAVEADSTFALALFRLSTCYGWTESVLSPKALGYAEQASRHSGRLAERDATLVRGQLALIRGTLDGWQPLEEGVQRYPDDVEMWYLLGETYEHLGFAHLVEPSVRRQAFQRAWELDPSFAPAYIHPTENAFIAADSAAVADLTRRYARVAPDEFLSQARALGLARDLVWGEPEVRQRARAAFDTVHVGEAVQALLVMRHPRFLALGSELARSFRERPENRVRPTPVWEAWIAVERGRLREMLAILDDPRTNPNFRMGFPAVLLALDVPLPAERAAEAAARARAFAPVDSNFGVTPLWAAVTAADQGRWSDVDQAVGWTRANSARFLAAGDSTSAAYSEALVPAIEGYGAWRRGELERALPLLEEARVRAVGHGPRSGAHEAIRLWLGRALLEAGRADEAVRHLESVSKGAIGGYELGLAYERAGRRDDARRAYELFLIATAEADPAYRDRIEAARESLARLSRVRRG